MVKGAALACLAAILAVASLEAHSPPVEVVAYYKVDGRVLHVLARLPVTTLTDARLPVTKAGALVLPAARPILAAAVADFARNAAIMDSDRTLAVSVDQWTLALPGDTSFDAYDSARAHVAGAGLPDTAVVDASRAFLDLRLDYTLSPAAAVSVRFNGLRNLGAFVPTRATYITADGALRTFFVEGEPHRVLFEPSWLEAASTFVVLGFGHATKSWTWALFVFCLVSIARTGRTRRSLVALSFVSFAAAGLLTPSVRAEPGAVLQAFALLTASAALIIAALQCFVPTGIGWAFLLSAAFGAATGVGAGAGARDAIAFAGSHGALSLVLFLSVVTGVAGIAVPVSVAIVERVRQSRPLARVAPVLLSLVPLHAALHSLDAASREPGASSGVLALVTGHWVLALAVTGLALLALMSKLPRVSRAEAG